MRVGDYSVFEDSVILPNVVIGRSVTLRRVVVDKHCVIPDGFRAGVCPEQDKTRFHVTDRGITLITADMLGESAAVPSISASTVPACTGSSALVVAGEAHPL